MDYSQCPTSVKRTVRANPGKPQIPNSVRFGRHRVARTAHRAASPAVAQARGEPVDRQMYSALGELIGLARAIATQQLDLEVIERIEIGEAIANASRQRRIVVKERRLAGNRVHQFDGPPMLRGNSRKNLVPCRAVRNKIGVARRYGEV